jgi:hypothetical protein
MLPNLLIIGAAKCGTTSLHAYLDHHPEISMAVPRDTPDVKEMRYFWRADWRELRDWYEGHFDVATPIRGEATPSYTHFPYLSGVPERIHSVIPDAKLIYVVGDPVKRIASHWVQLHADGDPTPFEWYLRHADRPDNRVVCASKYATQVQQYLSFFDRSQILVIDQYALRSERRATLTEVFAFLGVDDSYESEAFDRELNVRADKYRLTRLGAPLWRRVVAPALRRLPAGTRRSAAGRARRLLSRKVTASPVIESDAHARLRDILQPEVNWLREFTGREFATWSL